MQIADAAFSFDQTPAWKVNSLTHGQFNLFWITSYLQHDDSKVYSNKQIADAGRSSKPWT